MPEAICDTSPLQYLHQLGLLDLLPQLYGRVIVPRTVARELATGRALGVNVPDVTSLRWVEIRDLEPDATLAKEDVLGPGERDASSLAFAAKDALLLVDDGIARQFARRRGLRFTGTLGVLLRAKSTGLIPLIRPHIDALRTAGFRLTPLVEAIVLREAGES